MTTRRQPGILTGMPFMANLAARTFVDDMGRKLFLSQAPRRIVSLAPSVTEMLYAIGAGNQVVAVTGLCDFPLEVSSKPKVGQLSANLETLVALQPDLVIAPHGFLSAEVLEQFERLKLPLLLLRAQSVDDIFRHITTLGRLLNQSKMANELAAELRARLKRIKANTQGRPSPRVLYVLNMEPLITVGPGTFIQHVIEMAGGSNIARDAVTEYPRLSMETVLARNPDVLVFPTGETEGIPESDRLAWRRWPTLSAVQSGRFIDIPSVLLDRPGPRLLDGLERLARALHPDAFPEATLSGQP
ncbi:ABC transporter substrate-binding protein [Nitrospira sp.]|nr:ABC transporter substrate-binding protein [Nitrospira sp.]